jgi:effector-binding domain-containing protein
LINPVHETTKPINPLNPDRQAKQPDHPKSYTPPMQPQIFTTPLEYTIHGHSLRHDPAQKYGQEILSLLGLVWPVLKSNNIPNDGINRVVYDDCNTLFAGVILTTVTHPAAATLERKTIHLTRYAYWKHIGPYHLIPATATAMTKALEAQGHKTGWPMIEVYGHWTNDESKLETETFVELR